MLSTARILVLSAAVSVGVVTAAALPGALAASSGKLFNDRLVESAIEPGSTVRGAGAGTAIERSTAALTGKADSLAAVDCAAQTWPRIDAACLTAIDGTPVRQATRTITIESRNAANTSTLVRVPRAALAQR